MEVAKGVHRLTDGVANFYLVEDAGKLLAVDAGMSRDWGLLLRGMSMIGRALDDLEVVLITHAHPDHTGFAERARADAGAAVWIHEADAAVAKGAKPGKSEGKLRAYLLRGTFWRSVAGLIRHGGVKVVPIREVSAFGDGQRIDAPGDPRAIHVPGHTPGMSALLLEGRGVLFTGDSLVTKNPLTGRRGPQIMPSALNRDSGQALRSLSALERTAADVVLPGHGEPWTGGAAKAVRLARAAGRS